MGAGHRQADFHRLFIARESPAHRLPAQAKLCALALFVTAVAITPRHAVWACAIDAAILATVAGIARIPVRVIAARVLVVAPFLAAAAVVPFIGDGPRTRLGPVEVSSDGLWAAWNIVAKALLGTTASVLLTATTAIPSILDGMSRLRMPALLVSIVSFMIRYLDLIADQLHRMRMAMTARGHDPRWLWQARPIASAAGTLFVRTYERGERVHQAMVARGFTGHMPDLHPVAIGPRRWIHALVPPAAALAVAIAALAR